MASIFSKIVAGEIPCYKVAESDKFLAFLDVFPIRKGHTLVIPKKETDQFFDIDDATLSEMIVFAKRVASGVKKHSGCNRVSAQVIGLEVPHAHIHLIPINTMNDCNFSQEKLKLTKEEFEEIASSIRTLI